MTLKTQSLAERKRRDRERQAARRQAMKENRRPSTHACDAAIVEAVAFQLRTKRTAKGKLRLATVGVYDLIETAKTILIDREGYDADQTKVALTARLAARKEHEWSDHIPHVPPEVLQVAREEETAS